MEKRFSIKKSEMIKQIAKLPRVNLGCWPTPLVDAKHLTEVLGGPRILVKREDLTGLALGGNKCRILEFMIGDVRQKGFDSFVISGISNMSVQLAAAAAKLGMKFKLILFGRDATLLPLRGGFMKKQGNYILHRILDSDTKFLEPLGPDVPFDEVEARRDAALEDEITKLRKAGYNPFLAGYNPFLRRAHGNPTWGAGWLNAVDEIWQQLKIQGIEAQYLVVANGEGKTQVGLQVGVECLEAPFKVIGISIMYKRDKAISEVVRMSNETARSLRLGTAITPDKVTIYDQYIGEGYYKITEESTEAIRLVAQTEGFFLDPFYSGKAMAGLIDLIRKGRFTARDTVVFIHTGGVPELFAYGEEMSLKSPGFKAKNRAFQN